MENKNRQKNSIMKKGFSLMELMVVIVILGILAAFVLPNLFGAKDDAKAADTVETIDAIKKSTLVVIGQNDGTINSMTTTIKDEIVANISTDPTVFNSYTFGHTNQASTGKNAFWLHIGTLNTDTDKVATLRKMAVINNNKYDKSESLADGTTSDDNGMFRFDISCTGTDDCYILYYMFDDGIPVTNSNWKPTTLTYNAPSGAGAGYSVTAVEAYSN